MAPDAVLFAAAVLVMCRFLLLFLPLVFEQTVLLSACVLSACEVVFG